MKPGCRTSPYAVPVLGSGLVRRAPNEPPRRSTADRQIRLRPGHVGGVSGAPGGRRRHGQIHDDDPLIAAFARRLRATLVTNNTADFTDLDVPVIDWTADQPGG